MAEDFSLVLGGPLYQLFLRGRMLRPPLSLLRRRLLALTTLSWLPLFVLAAAEGRLLTGTALPFLQDLEVQARFLLALPLLVVAEVLVHRRLGPAVGLFLEKGIVRERERGHFEGIVASTLRLRNSLPIELFLIALVFTGGHYLWQERVAVGADTWYATLVEGGSRVTMAGRYYIWISVPIFQFLLLRWYFRLLLWCQFLWRVSRLDLALTPAHPDRGGGLGFLGGSTYAFAPLLVSQSVLIAAMVGSRILHHGAQLQAFKYEIAGSVVFALLQALGPLLVFAPSLAAAKRRGLRDYGVLADRYVREFDRKWLQGGAAPEEAFVGSADIQSLADLGNSYAVVREMRPIPFGKETVLQLAAVTIVPLLPLALTIIPFEDLVRRVLGALL